MPTDFWATFSDELSIVVLGQEVEPRPINSSGNRPLRCASEPIKIRRTSKFKELSLHLVRVKTYECGHSIQPYNGIQLSYGGRLVFLLLYIRDMFNRRETRGVRSGQREHITPLYFG